VGTPEINFSIVQVPGTERVIVGNSTAKLVEFNFADEKPTATEFAAGHTSYVTGLAWTSGGIVSGSYDRQLRWWNPETRECTRTQENAHEKWIRRVLASPDGATVVSIADDMQVKVWDAQSGELRATLKDHQPE